MKDSKTSKVVIGAEYGNSGDVRIPIYSEPRELNVQGFVYGGFHIFYIERRSDEKFFSYNLYMNCVTETQFLLKWKRTKNENVLSKEVIDVIQNAQLEADQDFINLRTKACVSINLSIGIK